MSADQYSSIALHKSLELSYLAFAAAGRAKIPLILDFPVFEKTVLGKICRAEGCADRAFWHCNNHLVYTLMVLLVETSTPATYPKRVEL